MPGDTRRRYPPERRVAGPDMTSPHAATRQTAQTATTNAARREDRLTLARCAGLARSAGTGVTRTASFWSPDPSEPRFRSDESDPKGSAAPWALTRSPP